MLNRRSFIAAASFVRVRGCSAKLSAERSSVASRKKSGSRGPEGRKLHTKTSLCGCGAVSLFVHVGRFATDSRLATARRQVGSALRSRHRDDRHAAKQRDARHTAGRQRDTRALRANLETGWDPRCDREAAVRGADPIADHEFACGAAEWWRHSDRRRRTGSDQKRHRCGAGRDRRWAR